MKKYTVTLAYSRPECDIYKLEYVKSDSIEELQKAVRDFIDENCVMASEWEGGQVYDLKKRKLVGIIAYNGKFFIEKEAKRLGLK